MPSLSLHHLGFLQLVDDSAEVRLAACAQCRALCKVFRVIIASLGESSFAGLRQFLAALGFETTTFFLQQSEKEEGE